MEGFSLSELAGAMQLTNLTPEISLEEITVTTAEINRPALQLTGYFEYYDPNRIQIVGKVESTFLETRSKEEQLQVYRQLFEHGMPCLIFSRDYRPREEILALARQYTIPILGTPLTTSVFTGRILRYLEVRLAPMTAVHGVLVDVFGEGVLILGESGIGKSEAALELIKRGHRLVSDDTVELRRYSETELVGSAPEVTRYLMELRGIGIIDVKALYGVECVKDAKTVSMVVRLKAWDGVTPFERLAEQTEQMEYLGNKLDCYTVPVSPGRNVAVIVETAALNARQKRMGYDALAELKRRIETRMQQSLGQ